MSNYHPENILEAFCAAPADLLDIIVDGMHKFISDEKELILHGEYDEDELSSPS